MQDKVADRPLIEELLKEGKKADRLDKERAEVLAILLKSQGWSLYEGLLQDRIQALGDEMLEPCKGIEGVLSQEFVKGTLKGLILARDLPSVIVESMKQQIPEKEDEE